MEGGDSPDNIIAEALALASQPAPERVPTGEVTREHRDTAERVVDECIRGYTHDLPASVVRKLAVSFANGLAVYEGLAYERGKAEAPERGVGEAEWQELLQAARFVLNADSNIYPGRTHQEMMAEALKRLRDVSNKFPWPCAAAVAPPQADKPPTEGRET